MEVLEVKKEQMINELFNILVQFEKIDEFDSGVTEETYKNYLDRLYVWHLGYGNNEIAFSIKGLFDLGRTAKHDSVKRVVFHMIDVVNKEERD